MRIKKYIFITLVLSVWIIALNKSRANDYVNAIVAFISDLC